MVSATRIPPGSRLAIDKALRQIAFIASRYGQHITNKDMEIYQHDFQIAHSFNDLHSIEIEFVSSDGRLAAGFSVEFNPITGKVVDDARGIEYPRLPRELVQSLHVLQVNRHANVTATYRHLLVSTWSTAERSPRGNGETYVSRHCAAISGQFCQGEFFVCDSARHVGIIRRISDRGDYAYCRDSLELADVFLHAAHCDNGLKFSVGLPVSYILTKTQRGFRGERIRKA